MLRTAVGISQKELARRLDISPSYLSLIENDERELSVSLLRQISRELGVPISAFFFDAGEANSVATPDQEDERNQQDERTGKRNQPSVQEQFGQIVQRLLAYEQNVGSSAAVNTRALETKPARTKPEEDVKPVPGS